MKGPGEEDELLRSVALQNAQSISLARQRAEEALRKQSEWLQVTLASIGDAVISTDAEGRISFMNGVAQSLTAWSEAEALGRPLLDVFRIINEQNRQPVENPALRALREGVIVGLANHTILITKDGRERPIDDSAAPIRDDQGNVAGCVLIFRDVSQQRLAIRALERSEARKTAILETSLDAVITCDQRGLMLEFNPAAERIFGYRRADMIGRDMADLIVPLRLRERHRQGMAHYLLTGEGPVLNRRIEMPALRSDGTEFPSELAITRISGEGPPLFTAYIRDISERKQTEETLRRNERELADFFENAAVGLHWVGPDGTILRVNRAELELLGYSREEYVGRRIAEFHVDKDVIADILRRLAEGEMLRDCEARMRCRDGSIKHVLIDSSVLWQDGKFVHTRCFTRDVTDRKRVEEVQSRLAAIVESSQDAIIGKTLDNRIHSWNAGAEQLFGYTAQEAIGQLVTRLIPPERQDEERLAIEALRRGERIDHFETVRITRDGRRLDVSLTTSPIRDSGGSVVGASTIARDITANKRAEQRLMTQHVVARALAESATLDEAAAKILQAICDHLGWEVGGLWYVDQSTGTLNCSEMWHRPSIQIEKFESASRNRKFEKGIGLPGRVWASAKPFWIADAVKDDNFPRGPDAAAEGLHGAVGFPIILNAEVLGVIEFFSPEIRQPDEDVLRMMTSIGSQIGQFIERKRAEEALRESEARFRTLSDHAPVLIWLNSPTGCEFVNRSYLEFLGVGDQDVQGMNWAKYVHPDDYETYIGGYAAALQKRSLFESAMRFRRADGVYRHMKTIGIPRFSPAEDFLGYVGCSFDITDLKHAEESTRFLADASAALAELTDYESTLQKVAALAVPFFADWCAVDMQQADGSIHRLAVTHADPARVGLAQELFRRYPPEPTDAHGFMKVLRTGQPEWMSVIPDSVLVESARDEDHLRIMRQLGLKSFICAPLRSRTKVLGALTFVTAESGRIYDASDLAAAEDLAHRAVIAIENANLLAALKESDRRKDEFLAMLAHELRNPLAPIRNSVQIFRNRDLTPSQRHWATEVIDRQVHQMTRLVDDLLDVSRITRGKIELRKERVELAEVLTNAVEASRPLIEKWGHELTLSVGDQPIALYADPTRLAQVFQNLLNNAAKYMDQGGHIWVSAERQDDRAVVRVLDTGIGIPPEMLPRIFDMFTQVDHSLDRAEGGLGLGLTLVQRLVEMHGGSVSAHSEGLGQGSEFVVRLPFASNAQIGEFKPADEPTKPRTLGSRRILIVDDNRDAADTLGLLLRDMGNIVHLAYDGLEAVAAAATYQPEIILLDIGLPKLNGYEAARRIREAPGGADILLVALTGWGQDEDRRRSREAGFDHHLTKPVGFAALEKLLAEAKPDRTE